MRKHVTIIGALYIGIGALQILAAIIVAVVLVGSGFIAAAQGDQEPFWILVAIAAGVGLFLLLFAVPQIVGGIGLLYLRPWARYLVMILAVFKLFNVPIGTAIGIYTLWALVQNDVERLFARPGTDQVDMTSTPTGP